MFLKTRPRPALRRCAGNSPAGFSSAIESLEERTLLAVSTPFSGTPITLPATIQAENFDLGDQNVAYSDTTKANQGGAYRSTRVDLEPSGDTGGGYNVGWIYPGEWLNYTINVPATGAYLLQARVQPENGGTFHVSFGGVNKTGSIKDVTGKATTWLTLSTTVQLTQGVQVMQVDFDTAGTQGFIDNLNWIALTPAVTVPPPAAPSGLTSVATSPTSASLSWVDNSTNESGYTIERATGSGGSFSTLISLAAGSTSYTDSTVLANTQYSYRVKATSSSGDSSYSNTTTLTTPAPPLVVSAGGPYLAAAGTSITLVGTAAGGTGKLQYAWDLDGDGTFETVGQTVSTTFPAAGSYSVNLQVTDASSRVAQAAASITVSPAPAGTVYSGPIVITSGGTYTGNWQSDDPNIPAVTIKTTAPVIIQNANLRGRGDLIDTAVAHVNLTVRNSNGYGENPNVAGLVPGRFLDAESFDNLLIQNNFIEGTSGIWLLGYLGNNTPGNTIKILDNQVHNIDGRKSDGAGGWLTYNERTNLSTGVEEDGYEPAQFVQFDKVTNIAGAEIAWNQVINDPGNSRVEDNINIYLSSGTAASPILIHDNYIQGAYTINPAQASYSDGTYDYDWTFAGGGILLGDGKATSLAQDTAYVQAYNNQVVSTTNYAIAIAAGHDISFYANRMISSDLLPNGQTIFGNNSGAYIWNSYGVSSSLFFNDSGSDNVVGWLQGSVAQNWWVPDATSWTNATAIAGLITLDTEAAELTSWLLKLKASQIIIGVPPAQ